MIKYNYKIGDTVAWLSDAGKSLLSGTVVGIQENFMDATQNWFHIVLDDGTSVYRQAFTLFQSIEDARDRLISLHEHRVENRAKEIKSPKELEVFLKQEILSKIGSGVSMQVLCENRDIYYRAKENLEL